MFYGAVIVVILLIVGVYIASKRRESVKASEKTKIASLERKLKESSQLSHPGSWYCVPITEEMIAEGAELIIINGFMELTVKAQEGEALFMQEPDEDVEHAIFFTPAAAIAAPILVTTYSGRPCAAPSRKTVEHILGDQAAERLLAD